MQITNILPLLAIFGTTAPASPLIPRGCFPDNTHQLVQSSQVVIGDLVNNVFQQDNTTGQANLVRAQDSLASLKASVRPDSACDHGAPPAWPDHLSPLDSQARAIDMLRSSQHVLMNVDSAVIECREDDVHALFCTATRLVDEIEGYYDAAASAAV